MIIRRDRILFLVLYGLLSLLGTCVVNLADDLRFEFLEPRKRAYQLEAPQVQSLARQLQAENTADSAKKRWIRAWAEGSEDEFIEISSRVLLKCESPELLADIIAASPASLQTEIEPGLVVLETASPLAAAREAARLARVAGVLVSHPIQRRQVSLRSPYVPRPNDPYFPRAWHLENRDPVTGVAQGFDLNARSAWAATRGAGVVVAVADEGVQITHPDLAVNGGTRYHNNFHTGVRDGRPMTSQESHGTAVAGLAVAAKGNRTGASGVAPDALFCSWVIFDSFGSFIGEQTTMEMFEYENETVSIQNHSWGNASPTRMPILTDENVGIERAVTEGRGGRGVVLVRAAGNERQLFNDTNDDGFAQDPRAISVGAVRANGQVCSFSTPGATVLVSAFSGDPGVDLPNESVTNYPSLFTTDRVGAQGYNADTFDTPDYTSGDTLPGGTSFSTPQIVGLCALMLSVNPALTYRDVQQILVLSSQPADRNDPELQLNGAGLWVSHNVGYGIPDAGVAVRLAENWNNRPSRQSVSAKSNKTRQIPDDGLRVVVSGLRVPLELESIPAFPVGGLHADDPTESLDLVDLGLATSLPKQNLAGKAALIQRGENYYVQKLAFAAAAGAEFAVIYNNTGETERLMPNGADIRLATIPAVFIDQRSGEALANHVRLFPGTEAKLQLNKVEYGIEIQEPLICEHVKLELRASHARRADVRLTLVSPSGTRSVLQRRNQDTISPMGNWDYYSAMHFFEPAAGEWRVEVSDQSPGVDGRVLSTELTVFGVPIKDTDRDGLDDDWELEWFETLSFNARHDNDGDGWSNAREQAIRANPAEQAPSEKLEFTPWDDRLTRLSWPALDDTSYRVRVFDDLGQPAAIEARVEGRFPEAVWLGPSGIGARRFFSVERLANP